MRACVSVVWVGVITLSRTNRPDADTWVVVTFAVLPRTCPTVVKVLPSLDTCRS